MEYEIRDKAMKLYHATDIFEADKIQSNGFFDYEYYRGTYPDGVLFSRDPWGHPDQELREAIFIIEFPEPDEIIKYRISEGRPNNPKDKVITGGNIISNEKIFWVEKMWIIPANIANKYFTDKKIYDLLTDFE